jgi:DNA replication and repair protein RecF
MAQGDEHGLSARHVMAGHSRSKNGVASLAYVPAIHVFLSCRKDVDARHRAGHDDRRGSFC